MTTRAEGALRLGFSVDGVPVPSAPYRLTVNRLVGGVFTADAAAVEDLLPTAGLHPLRFLPGRTLLFINCTDAWHHIGSLPPIRCASMLMAAVATPGERPAPYLTPVLSDEATIKHGAGLAVLASVSTSRVVSEFSRAALGWPGSVGDIRNRQGPGFERFMASDADGLIVEVGIRPTGKPERWGPTFWTYGVREGRVLGWPMVMSATTTQLRYGPRSSRLRLGAHPAVADLQGLGVSLKGVIGSFHTDGTRVIDQPPFDLGAGRVAAPPSAPAQPSEGRYIVVDADGRVTAVGGHPAGLPIDPAGLFVAEPITAVSQDVSPPGSA